jgi:hypothetical protein
MLKTLFVVAALVGSAASLSAQAYPDTYKVNYFINANTSNPDATVNITNVGTVGKPAGDHAGTVCALIYVFDPNQELSECCGCSLSPDGLRTLSLDADLTSNPLTSVTLTTGVIKIVSSMPTATGCNPAMPSPASGIRAWATHIQNTDITETAFQDSTLSGAELSNLVAECKGILLVGSGRGTCSCGTGD